MILYYSGASKYEGSQPDPFQSLGGYPSNSKVQNGLLNNLFGTISQGQMIDGSVEKRLIVLKNTSGSTQNISLYYDIKSIDSINSYRMALVTPTSDGCGGFYFEEIANGLASPVSAVFADNRGSGNGLTASVDNGDYLGIWIERRVSKVLGSNEISCATLIANSSNENTSTSIALSFNDETNIDTNLHDQVVKVYTPSEQIAFLFSNGGALTADTTGFERVLVTYSGGDSAAQILTKFTDKINEILSPRGTMSATIDGSTITILISETGKVAAPTTAFGQITLVTTQGTSDENSTTEEAEITIDY